MGAAALGLLVADNANDAHEVIVPIVNGTYICTYIPHQLIDEQLELLVASLRVLQQLQRLVDAPRIVLIITGRNCLMTLILGLAIG